MIVTSVVFVYELWLGCFYTLTWAERLIVSVCEKFFWWSVGAELVVSVGLLMFLYGGSASVCGVLVCCLACASMLVGVRIE